MLRIFKNLKKIDVLYIFICIGLIVLQVWLDLTMPDYTNKLSTAVSSGSIDMNEIYKNGGLMLLCAFGSMTSAIAVGYFCGHVAANFARTLRTKLFDKISSFSSKEMNEFTTASLITRTTNDVVQMQGLIAMGMQVLIKAPILAIWAIFKISATGIEWTMATVICVVVIIVTVAIVVGLAYPRFKRIQVLTDNLNNISRENITGVRVIRAYNAEAYQANKFDIVNSDVMKTQLFTSRAMAFLMPVITICMNGLTLAIYWIGAILMNRIEGVGMPQLMERAQVIGDMMAFTSYALQVVMAFMMLIMIFMILPRAMVSAKRINEVLDTKPSITYNDTEVICEEKGTVEFKDVSFSYNGDVEHSVLTNLSFKINKGETFAIIGATGSGKSTMMHLVSRFYDATEGEVLIDGVDVRKYPQNQLTNIVSLAPQKAILFKGDIKSNVVYGSDNEVQDDDIRLAKALDIAKCDFVYEDEKGIHKDVAQKGTNLSGGQKQRVSIARALFKESEIMIFDDTFSALDYKTDMLVRKGIKENMKGVTTIIIAQRIGTIKNADQILVLDDGKIAGIGKHDELMKSCNVYQEIALSQLSKEEL